MASIKPAHLVAAVARLTQAKPHGNHVLVFRMPITASDGKRCGVTVRVSEKKVYANSLNQLADSFRLGRDMIEHVLENWTHDQMVEHLQRFRSDVLDSDPALRKFKQQPGP